MLVHEDGSTPRPEGDRGNYVSQRVELRPRLAGTQADAQCALFRPLTDVLSCRIAVVISAVTPTAVTAERVAGRHLDGDDAGCRPGPRPHLGQFQVSAADAPMTGTPAAASPACAAPDAIAS